MKWIAARHLALAAGFILAGSCATSDDITGPTENTPAAQTETAATP
jgi:hypothetical protein